MQVMRLKFSEKFSSKWKIKWKMSRFSILALALCSSGAWGQAPAVLVDAQQTIGTGYNVPQSIAVSKNGTIFVADTNNNQIIALTNFAPEPGVSNPVSTGAFTLTTPQALALDANGNLFVGDTPSTGGRIIELLGDGNGNLTGVAKLIVAGSPLTNPISLAIDSSGTLFIGDYNIASQNTVATIFSLAPGSTALTTVPITGLPATLIPGALLRDSSTHLYIADNGALSNSVYIATATGGPATQVSTELFTINQPSGLALDAVGNLYILSLLGSGTGYNPNQQVVVIPASSPTTPYILPNTGLGSSTSMAFDPQGNLDIADDQDGTVVQLAFLNPTNMGDISVGQTGKLFGLEVMFNFEYNAPTTLQGFRVVTQGDVSTELIQDSGGTCTNGNHTNLGGGGPAISPYYPFTCKAKFYGNPKFPGLRASAIQVKGLAGTILASTPVYQTAFAGVEVTYPLNQSTTAIDLQEPQALAITGLDKKVYVADTQAGKVYSTVGLAGAKLTPLSTGTIALQAPTALALDGAGNLFIADFNLAEVVEVPTTTGAAPSVVNTGGLLQHPIALAFDYLGNLYIGDAGPGGNLADSGNPGFLVKIPSGGAPFKMVIPANVSIVFPQSLATDPYTADLLVGDGGDPSGVGQVVLVSAGGATASPTPVDGVTNPTGLAFDQAEDLYILDGNAETITIVSGQQSGLQPYPLPFDNANLSAASALAISAGGQSFVIANIGQRSSNSLVYLNGNTSTLSFGGVKIGSQSATMTATENNIGNLNVTLQSPFYTTSGVNSAFSVLGSSTCGNGIVIQPSVPCTINVQFTPTALGQTKQRINVDSDSYNSGLPTLTVEGTGNAAAAVKAKN